jgi:A/G-specific adenine glycosylase
MTKDPFEHFDAPRCRSLRQSLLRWYGREARPLPWRQTRDPYHIWISEIMLQQTTVKAVIPYFERFLARFPTVQDLATAEEAEVLQYWEGLGYYSRGRHLRLAAQHLCEKLNGQFPADIATLRKLPGIGRYTAGAIRSFAFNLPAPIVEANTLRVYCRLLGYDGNPRSQAGQKLLWGFAEHLQPARAAGHLNQALMELGATLCTFANPRCEECPIRQLCLAFQQGRQTEIPTKGARPDVTQTVEATVAVHQNGRLLIRQRGKGERWAGMWDFVRFPIESIAFDEKLTRRRQSQLFIEATRRTAELTGLDVVPAEVLTEIRHSVTRYRIRLVCLTAACHGSVSRVNEQDMSNERTSQFKHDSGVPPAVPMSDANDLPSWAMRESSAEPSFRWVTHAELADLPMPVTGRKFARLLAAE